MIKLKKATHSFFLQYCNESYLPGFNYLIGDTPLWHKLFWLLVCVVFNGVTLYQIDDLFLKYGREPIKTTNEKSYKDELDFPKVIICNTMPFRVSQIRPISDMHYAIYKVYKSSTLDTEAALLPDVSAILSKVTDTEEYLRRVAHQAEDFIIGCKWEGKPCSWKDFSQIVTNKGICYAFNHDPNKPVLKVKQAGNNFGLELLLNIAKYEEMNGPYKVYGATVSVATKDIDTMPTAASIAVVGYYTTISLKAKEVNYINGKSCGSTPLKFFSTYTWEHCELEKTYESIRNECGCYPYVAMSANLAQDVITNKSEEICNFGKQLTCAQTHLDNPADILYAVCPATCSQAVYVPTESVALVAWEQVKGNFNNYISNVDRIKDQVREAFNIRKRYHPEFASTTEKLLKDVNHSSNEVNQMLRKFNETKLSSVPIPESIGAQPLKRHFNKFLRQIYDPLMVDFQSTLKELSQLFNETQIAMANYSDVLFGNATIDLKSITNNDHLPNMYRLVNGRLYLNAFPKAILTLNNIKATRRRFHADWTDGFYVLDSKTILIGRGKLLLDKMHQQVVQLLYRPEHIRSNDTTLGCLQRPFHTAFKLAKSNDTLLSCFLCYIRLFATPSTQIAGANDMAYFSRAMPDYILDVDEQSQMCNEQFCRLLGYQHACDINIKEKRKIWDILKVSIPQSIQTCHNEIKVTKKAMTDLTHHYTNILLPTYAMNVELANLFIRNDREVRKLLEKDHWPKQRNQLDLVENIDKFLNKTYMYEFANFSNGFANDYSNWLDPSSNLLSNNVEQDMEDVIFKLEHMQSSLNQLLVQKGYASVGKRNSFAHRRNAQDHRHLKPQIQQMLKEFATANKQFASQASALIKDCTQFQKETEITNEFCSNNFMIVNVVMGDLSYETVTQQYATEFWALIADVGGASSFWLGLHLGAVVQMIDFCLRFCIRLIWPEKKRKETDISL